MMIRVSGIILCALSIILTGTLEAQPDNRTEKLLLAHLINKWNDIKQQPASEQDALDQRNRLRADIMELLGKGSLGQWNDDPPEQADLRQLPWEGWTEEELIEEAERGNAEACLELACRTNEDLAPMILHLQIYDAPWSRIARFEHWIGKAIDLGRPGAEGIRELFRQAHGVPGQPVKQKELMELIRAGDESLSRFNMDEVNQQCTEALKDECGHVLTGAPGEKSRYAIRVLRQWKKSREVPPPIEKPDAAALVTWCGEAAEAGDPQAMFYWLLFCDRTTWGVDDPERVIRYARELVRRGYVPAIDWLLEDPLTDDQFEVRDFVIATHPGFGTWEFLRNWDRIMVVRGSLRAVRHEIITLDPSNEQDFFDCVDHHLRRLHKMGSSGMVDVAFSGLSDAGAKRRFFRHIESFLSKRDPDALLMLATVYDEGIYVKPDREHASALRRIALRDLEIFENYPVIHNRCLETKTLLLRSELAEGAEAKRIYHEAFALYRDWNTFVHRGKGELCFLLGHLLQHGEGLEHDDGQAFRYYEEGVTLDNNPDCFNSLALCYEEGKGVAPDIGKARQLFRKAAWHGSKVGRENLRRLEKAAH